MVDWVQLAQRSRLGRRLRLSALSVFLVAVSIPIAVPYIWMVMIAFTARRGMAETGTLWPALVVILVGLGIYGVAMLWLRRERLAIVISVLTAFLLGLILLGQDLHLQNFRFMVNANIIDDLDGQGTVGERYPWVWEAFANSLLLASTQTVIVVTLSLIHI